MVFMNSEIDAIISGFVYYIHSISCEFKYTTEKEIYPWRLSFEQLHILLYLQSISPNGESTNNLRKYMYNKESNVSRIVSKLSDKQLVKKSKDPNHKQKVIISITDKGSAIVCEIENHRKSFLSELLGDKIHKIEMINDSLREILLEIQ